MGEGKITDKETLKKKYLPLIIEQLKKGAFPQNLKPRLLKMGFSEAEADDLLQEGLAAAAPSLGPKAAAARAGAKPEPAPAPEPKKAPKYVNYSSGAGGETAKAEQAYVEAKEKLLASGFNPFEAEKMARTKASEVELEAKREKLITAGFQPEEAEKMLKSSATTSLYGQPVAPGAPAVSTIAPNLDYAGFLSRFLALIIDGLILMIPSGIISLIFVGLPIMTATGGMKPGLGSIFLMLVGTILNMGIYWFYFAAMESGKRQATYGKSFMGIAVTDEAGNQISFARATGRYFAKAISAGTLCIGYLMALFTPKNQALHDYIAGTLVVKSR